MSTPPAHDQPNRIVQTFSTMVGWVVRTILAGVVLILPFVLILAILNYIYFLLTHYVIGPVAKYVLPAKFEDPFLDYSAPVLSLLIVLSFLFLMGLLFRTRVRLFLDWIMTSIPGVSTLYSAIRDTSRALQGPPGIENVDTVVLVPFPQQNMRMAGYLMAETKDEQDRPLVCVYVPLVLFPPSGYTVILPEEDIVYTQWEAKEVWKLLLSGGLTLPNQMPFSPNAEQKTGSAAKSRDQDGPGTTA